MRYMLLHITFMCCVYVTPTASDVFMSLMDLERLIPAEKELADVIDRYIEAENKRLEKVRKIKDDYKEHHELISTNPESFLSNPLNAFVLVKKLTTEWYSATNLMLEGTGRAILMNLVLEKPDLILPKEVDLRGATEALLKLQEVYKLDSSSLARGGMTGSKPFYELSANDCFELGRQSLGIADYHYASLWMHEALKRLDTESQKTASKPDILEHLASAAFKEGNLTGALDLIKNLLELVPDHPRVQVAKDFYEYAVNNPETVIQSDYKRKYGWKHYSERSVEEYEDEQEAYGKLCRGEVVPPPSRKSLLLCRYRTNGNPSLLLMPVKEEEMNNDPKILVYHKIITGNEIEHLKTLSRTKLKRHPAQDVRYGLSWHLNQKIAKSATLLDQEDAIVSRLSRKVQDITGFAAKTAEPWTVLNYGVGGHSDPHFDFSEDEELRNPPVGGKNIATWFMYLSDITAGGATVFTELNVTVPVEKGSAVFYLNLLTNGQADRSTKHADCPVLRGIKWAAKKSFRVVGQDGRQRCALNQSR